MRAFVLSVFSSTVLLLPTVGNAQVYSWVTPPPQVTAASADWQLRGDPIFFAGGFYDPNGPAIFFDGKVMARSGNYLGVPLYTDSTLVPFSKIFVPIGRELMRPYERRREDEPQWSRSLPFPNERDYDASRAVAAIGVPVVVAPGQSFAIAEPSPAVGTGGTVVTRSPQAPAAATGDTHTKIAMIPEQPRERQGLWIDFEGAKWYHNGVALSYDADRFVAAGEYRGFNVYREKADSPDTIYVAVVKNGPLTPYRKQS
jgi:hypothetical protein